MKRAAPAPVPDGWTEQPTWAVLSRVKETGQPDLTLLSVYRDYGVIPKDSRDDNYNKSSLDLTAYQVVKPGRVVANKMKTWQGSIAVSNFEGIVSPAYMVFDADPTIHGRFLHYLLRSRPYVAEYARLSHGVRPAQWDLRWDDLRDVRLLVPPRHVQTWIADFLDRETHRIDSLVEAKKKLIDLLAEKRAALISQAVTQGLDPTVPMKDSGVPWFDRIPASWTVGPLKRVAQVRYGLGQPPPTRESGVPILRATNIERGRINSANLMYVDLSDIPTERAPLLQRDEILVVRSGAYTGDSAIITEDYIGSAPGYDLRVTVTGANPAFVAWSLLGESVLHQIALVSSRAAQPHLNAEELGGVVLALPSTDVQALIAEYLSMVTGKFRVLDSALRTQVTLLAEYRQALITAAVTGQLDEATLTGERATEEALRMELPA